MDELDSDELSFNILNSDKFDSDDELDLDDELVSDDELASDEFDSNELVLDEVDLSGILVKDVKYF